MWLIWSMGLHARTLITWSQSDLFQIAYLRHSLPQNVLVIVLADVLFGVVRFQNQFHLLDHTFQTIKFRQILRMWEGIFDRINYVGLWKILLHPPDPERAFVRLIREYRRTSAGGRPAVGSSTAGAVTTTMTMPWLRRTITISDLQHENTQSKAYLVTLTASFDSAVAFASNATCRHQRRRSADCCCRISSDVADAPAMCCQTDSQTPRPATIVPLLCRDCVDCCQPTIASWSMVRRRQRRPATSAVAAVQTDHRSRSNRANTATNHRSASGRWASVHPRTSPRCRSAAVSRAHVRP